MIRATIFFAVLLGSTTLARADVPTRDDTNLGKRTEIQGTVAKVKLIQSSTQKSTKGVNCSVTTPKKADVKDPRQTPGSGTAKVQGFAPQLGAKPFDGVGAGTGVVSQNGSTGDKQLYTGSSDVVGGVDASQTTVTTNKSTYQTLSGQIGSTGTLMEAMDQNSAIHAQNGLSFNSAIQAANLFVMAYNLVNLSQASDMSQAGSTLVVPPITQPVPPHLCPRGTSGQGTAASPCVSQICSTTTYGTTPDPACVTRRYTDTAGNILFFLDKVQTGMPAAISAGDLQALISSYKKAN